MFYTRCLVCNRPYPPGTLTEHVPAGRRVAYDPERGRLWVICQACGGWTLAPFARRWEALEVLEKVVTTRGRRRVDELGRTDNVALFRVGGTEVIRIGHTGILEEAAWRYGQAHTRRGGGGGPDPFGPRPLGLGEWVLARAYRVRSTWAGGHRVDMAGARRWVRWGDVAWRGSVTCGSCGQPHRQVSFFQARTLILQDPGAEGLTPSLALACPRCGDAERGGLHLEGTAAAYVLRRVMAQAQDRGVPDSHLRAAAHLIELGGGPAGISGILARYGRYLSDLPPTSAVAVRILANEARERHLLTLEAAAVERQWVQEEELAAIVDGDLTDIPSLEGMRRLLRGGR